MNAASLPLGPPNPDSIEAAWEPLGWLAHQFRLNPATDVYRCRHCGQHAWIFERAKDLDARLARCPANPHHQPAPEARKRER